MKIRSLMLSLVLSLSLFFGAVQAQDTCFGLSASDCAVIDGAFGNAFVVAQSFKIDYSIDFSVTGVPDGNLTFNHTGSGPVAIDMMGGFPLKLDLSTNTSWNSPDGPGSGPADLRVVDGILYLFDGSAWMGINLLEAMENPDFADSLGLPFDPTNPEAALGALDGLDEVMTPELMTAVMGLLETPGFLTHVRQGDTFVFTMDLSAAMSSPSFTQALTAIGEAAGDPSVGMLGSMAPMILSKGLITVEQTVNTGLNIVDKFKFTVDASVNGAMLDPNMTEPVNVLLVFEFTLSEINGAFEFVAPEGATMMPLN